MERAIPPRDMMFDVSFRRYMGMKESDDRNGQGKDGDKGRTKMEEKNDDDQAHDDDLREERLLKIFNGEPYQFGTIISR